MAAKIWVVASGKGGVGKSFIASSLGITLSKLHNSVLLVDFDLNGGTLHSFLGSAPKKMGLAEYFSGEKTLSQLIQKTITPKVDLMSGVWNQWGLFNPPTEQIKKFCEELKTLPYDYVVVDTGVAYSTSTLELMCSADERIFICNSEPTAIEKFYRCFEAYYAYGLNNNSPVSYEKIQTVLREYSANHKLKCFQLKKFLKENIELSSTHIQEVSSKPVRLIVNQARSRQDQELGFSLLNVVHKYYEINLCYSGFVDFDNAVWQSVHECEPFLVAKPFTPLAGQLLTIARKLAATQNQHVQVFKAVV